MTAQQIGLSDTGIVGDAFSGALPAELHLCARRLRGTRSSRKGGGGI
jgi:hypothetical protein